MASDDYLLVAAIDFGTTFSGYAFSTRHDFSSDPQKMSLVQWAGGVAGLVSPKTSTCVLFHPDGRFHSFGYEAEDKYLDLGMDNEQDDWYLFRRFKMKLYEASLDRDFQLTDFSGKKTMAAITVISATIGYMKKHLMDKCKEQGVDAKESEIRWVLTVPAIWTDPAKQMMREAAEKCGIPKNNLILALEPEAASVLCKHIPVDKLSVGGRSAFDVFQAGSKYMVLDAGGGTIDITVHEVQANGNLKEIYKANGGDWGGTKVDDAFLELLEDIVGPPALKEFKSEHISDLLDLLRNFEVKKKTIKGDTNDKVTFTIPLNLSNAFTKKNPGKTLKAAMADNPRCTGHIELRGDKIRMSNSKTAALFKQSVDHITGHIAKLLRDPKVRGIDAILMVGGYSECSLLREAVRKLDSDIRLVVPNEAGLAVLKGAVITGHCPSTISGRVCKYTYGVNYNAIFVEGKHSEANRVVNEVGEKECEDAFSIFVKKGAEVEMGKNSVERSYIPEMSTQTAILFSVYASTEEEPVHVTDKSCHRIGKIRIEMPDTTRGRNRTVILTMCFAGSEISLKALEKDTGRSVNASCDFLG